MRRLLGRTAIAFSLAALSTFGFGCAGKTPEPRTARPKIVKKVDASQPPPVAAMGPALLPSHVVARLDGENPPYVARRGDELMLFFEAQGRLFTRLCAADGTPKSADPIDVGPATGQVPAAAIEAVGDGYLAAWVEGVKTNSTVKSIALDAAGNARGAPQTIALSAEEVTWVEILPNEKSSLVVWEVPREDHFDILASVVPLGKTPSSAIVLAHDAMGWDTVATPKGAAIVTIVPQAGAAERSDEGKLGRVLYAEVDEAGKVSPPVPVSAGATAQHDVVIARAGGRSIVAWTDVRDIDSSVYVASVEQGGKMVSPEKRATSPVGEQALVALISGGGSAKKALLAWEDLLRVPQDGRLIHLATIDGDATVGKERATLLFSSSGPPDITADGDGFAAMTLAPAASDASPSSKDAPIWPMFVRFGPDLAVRAAEPIRAEPFASNDYVPYLTRTLSCSNGTCTTLGQTSAPVTAALVSLPIRQSPWHAPAWRDPDDSPPRPSSLSALYDGDHLAKVASTDIPGGGTLAAWITYFIEGNEPKPSKGAKKDDALATVAVRAVSAQGVPGKTQVLSRRGLSIGGVAVASAPGGKATESALVWASREKNEAQVQIAKLGPDGDKLTQKALTTVARKPSKEGVPSEVSDVAVAYKPPTEPGKTTDDGWIVAWVDTRDGNAEVYAASVDRTLRKVVNDRRITEAAGDSAEVQIAVRGKDTFLVWSDARQNPDEGNGDIHVVRLDTRTLQKAGPEIRLFSSASHSRSPTISIAGDRLVVAWIEEPSPDAKGEDTESGVRIAVLDERGNLLGQPRLVRGEEQSPVTSVALACSSGSKCRGILTSAVRENMLLDAFEFSPGAPPGPLKSLAALTGGVSADVSPSFSGPSASSLFFGDDAAAGSGRVRHMTLAWP